MFNLSSVEHFNTRRDRAPPVRRAPDRCRSGQAAAQPAWDL